MTLPDPATTIENHVRAFDQEETAVEDTVRALIAAFPSNRKFTHVHIKVIAISQLYRARVLSVDAEALARHIVSLNIDKLLAKGSSSAVDLIHDCSTTRQKYYSFATKFCSWHNQGAYSLWDYNVDEALWAYRREGFTFKRGSLKTYSEFMKVIQAFRTSYGVQRYSLKNIDKFLWRVGDRLLRDESGN